MSPAPNSERAAAVRQRTERLARLLDSAVAIPGTRIRVGLDALIGLLPGIGDAIGLILGAWFLIEGARAGAPSALLWRMAGNVGLDALAGVVPVLGDLFDVAFRANLRNARLLGEHLDRVEGRHAPRRRTWLGYVLLAGLIAVLALAGYGVWTLGRALFAAVFGG
ncbi:MAG TPA: DUF4112 domain-containing protein [Solimonas sp.]